MSFEEKANRKRKREKKRNRVIAFNAIEMGRHNQTAAKTFGKQFRLVTDKSLCFSFNCTQIARNGNSISHFVWLLVHYVGANFFYPPFVGTWNSSNQLTISLTSNRMCDPKWHEPLNAITFVSNEKTVQLAGPVSDCDSRDTYYLSVENNQLMDSSLPFDIWCMCDWNATKSPNPKLRSPISSPSTVFAHAHRTIHHSAILNIQPFPLNKWLPPITGVGRDHEYRIQ